MATKIKDTPVLTGEDARRFMREIANPTPVSTQELERIKEVYRKFQAMERNDLRR